MRKMLGALLMSLVPCAAFANAASTDYTDLWWNQGESGWGANVALQGDTMLVTLFVYAGDHSPTWFVAPNTVYDPATKTYKGPLYATTGPYYVVSFQASTVTANQVGNLSFAPSTFNKALLTYNVGGQTIVKSVTRQSWRNDDLTGFYQGSRQGNWSNCGAGIDGKLSSAASVGVTQNGANVIISDSGKGYTCTYSGKYTGAGHMGQIEGMGICDDNVNRYLLATEVTASREAFTMRYHMEEIGNGCAFDGYVGGIRQAP
jgi:hypothetical protein